MTTIPTTLTIANQYGNVDVRAGCPADHQHVPGLRLQPLARALGVPYAEALTGFTRRRGQYRPRLCGIVVRAEDAPRVLQAISERAARRPSKEQRKARRDRQHEREVARFVAAVKEEYPGIPEDEAESIARHAMEVGSGRVGRTRTIHVSDAAHRAVVAHVRHVHTDYDDLHSEPGNDRDDARDEVASQVREILREWKEPQGNPQ